MDKINNYIYMNFGFNKYYIIFILTKKKIPKCLIKYIIKNYLSTNLSKIIPITNFLDIHVKKNVKKTKDYRETIKGPYIYRYYTDSNKVYAAKTFNNSKKTMLVDINTKHAIIDSKFLVDAGYYICKFKTKDSKKFLKTMINLFSNFKDIPFMKYEFPNLNLATQKKIYSHYTDIYVEIWKINKI